MEQLKNSPESKVYSKIKMRLKISEYIVDLAYLLLLSFTPLSQNVVNYIEYRFVDEYVQFLLFILCTGSVLAAAGILFDIYSTFAIEKDFGLLRMSVFSWLKDKCKEFLVSGIILLPLSMLFYGIIRNFPQSWWWIFSIVMIMFTVVLARIAPVLILPLFFKLKPIENESINAKIKKLMADNSVSFAGIYSFDLGEKTAKANAGFTGIGRSKKIIISDTLLQSCGEDEIVSVFAHEMGHYRHHHIIKNLVIGSVFIFAMFYVCFEISSIMFKPLGFISISDIAFLPFVMLVITFFSLVTIPLMNSISRNFEYQADEYAVQVSGKESFIAAMKTLAGRNLSDVEPNPVIEFLFYSHPSILKRIERAERSGGRI